MIILCKDTVIQRILYGLFNPQSKLIQPPFVRPILDSKELPLCAKHTKGSPFIKTISIQDCIYQQ